MAERELWTVPLGQLGYEQSLELQKQCFVITSRHAAQDSVNVIMQMCYLVNTYYLAGRKSDGQKILEDYVQSILKDHQEAAG